jgi:hypothetical protein
MKTILFIFSLLFTSVITFSNENKSMIIQNEMVQFKLINDTSNPFEYYVNDVKYTIEINRSAGISFPVNTIIKVVNAKSKKETNFIVITNDYNGKSIMLSEKIK